MQKLRWKRWFYLTGLGVADVAFDLFVAINECKMFMINILRV